VDTQNNAYSSVEGVLFNKKKTDLLAYPAGKQDKDYTIPAGVKTIGPGAFSGCTSLTGITVDTKNRAFSSIEGVLFNKKKKVLLAYPAGKQDKEYAIPSGVTTIGDEAFLNSNLTIVTIPKSVTTIGNRAFQNGNLTSVTIPNSVTSIGDNAFENNNLTSVTIPSSVTTLGEGVFDGNKTAKRAIIKGREDGNVLQGEKSLILISINGKPPVRLGTDSLSWSTDPGTYNLEVYYRYKDFSTSKSATVVLRGVVLKEGKEYELYFEDASIDWEKRYLGAEKVSVGIREQ